MPLPIELQHQQAVVKWSQQPEIRTKYPELAMLYHVPNERLCSAAYGAQLKRAGVKRGVPDLDLPVARGHYHGLRIEMKAPGESETPEQVWWREHLTEQGCMCEVCHGYKMAVAVIEWYMNLGKYKEGK